MDIFLPVIVKLRLPTGVFFAKASEFEQAALQFAVIPSRLFFAASSDLPSHAVSVMHICTVITSEYDLERDAAPDYSQT